MYGVSALREDILDYLNCNRILFLRGSATPYAGLFVTRKGYRTMAVLVPVYLLAVLRDALLRDRRGPCPCPALSAQREVLLSESGFVLLSLPAVRVPLPYLLLLPWFCVGSWGFVTLAL